MITSTKAVKAEVDTTAEYQTLSSQKCQLSGHIVLLMDILSVIFSRINKILQNNFIWKYSIALKFTFLRDIFNGACLLNQLIDYWRPCSPCENLFFKSIAWLSMYNIFLQHSVNTGARSVVLDFSPCLFS